MLKVEVLLGHAGSPLLSSLISGSSLLLSSDNLSMLGSDFSLLGSMGLLSSLGSLFSLEGSLSLGSLLNDWVSVSSEFSLLLLFSLLSSLLLFSVFLEKLLVLLVLFLLLWLGGLRWWWLWLRVRSKCSEVLMDFFEFSVVLGLDEGSLGNSLLLLDLSLLGSLLGDLLVVSFDLVLFNKLVQDGLIVSGLWVLRILLEFLLNLLLFFDVIITDSGGLELLDVLVELLLGLLLGRWLELLSLLSSLLGLLRLDLFEVLHDFTHISSGAWGNNLGNWLSLGDIVFILDWGGFLSVGTWLGGSWLEFVILVLHHQLVVEMRSVVVLGESSDLVGRHGSKESSQNDTGNFHFKNQIII